MDKPTFIKITTYDEEIEFDGIMSRTRYKNVTDMYVNVNEIRSISICRSRANITVGKNTYKVDKSAITKLFDPRMVQVIDLTKPEEQ